MSSRYPVVTLLSRRLVAYSQLLPSQLLADSKETFYSRGMSRRLVLGGASSDEINPFAMATCNIKKILLYDN